MDGCITDFVKGSLASLNIKEYSIPPGETEINKWPGVNISKTKFWKAIDATKEDFWVNLEKYPWTDELVEMCEKMGDLFILTSPSRNPHCLSGKMMWVQRYYERLQRKIVMTPAKYLCAAPGRILIDDTEDKINKFNDYGGDGILFPQPYNKNWNNFTDSKLNITEYIQNKIISINHKNLI